MIGVIGRKAFRPVEKGVDTRLAQHRHAVHGPFENGFEMVEILRQLVEFKLLGNALHRPGL